MTTIKSLYKGLPLRRRPANLRPLGANEHACRLLPTVDERPPALRKHPYIVVTCVCVIDFQVSGGKRSNYTAARRRLTKGSEATDPGANQSRAFSWPFVQLQRGVVDNLLASFY